MLHKLDRRLIAETGEIPAGYRFIRDTYPFEVRGIQTVSEDINGSPQPVTRITGLFQLGDKKNANGRFYPTRDVLIPAVNNIQEDVAARAVIGEYDHPCLLSPDFKVLTVDGWRGFRDIQVGDVVWSRVDGNTVTSRVNYIIDEPFHGVGHRLYGDGIDTAFTPAHKMLLFDTVTSTEFYAKVGDIAANIDDYSHCCIMRSAEVMSCVGCGGSSDYTSLRDVSVEEVQHNGYIYCLSVDHGNFFMEHNGNQFWTGNSDAKLHLDRASHLITKIWMEGRKVYGEAEILHRLPCGAMLRGLFEHKVRVGISSRGVGDMEVCEDNGHEVYRVLPGYMFITWDVVAEPSVSGAILDIAEDINKRTIPIRRMKHKFDKSTYQNKLVEAINEYFGLR